jgi:membrane protein implicated in regulation of membrane protease activity
MFFLWLGLFIGFLVLSLNSDSPELLIIALGAFIGSTVSLIPALDQNFLIQLIIVFSSILLSFVFFRKKLKKIFRGSEFREDFFEFSGRTAKVIETLSPKIKGRVEIAGTTWFAISLDEEFQPGDTVQVLEKEGLNLIVGRIQKEVEWKS